ncbi:MAG: hypothetical protein C0613_04185 [Desulfobulbaceae bacterium]|nr:MAG: hypothetical protein C0613_04185 [Desulfobulbaceae bacterium]
MPLQQAIALSLAALHQPVITRYQLGLFVFQLYLTKQFSGKPVRISAQTPDRRALSRAITQLLDSGVLHPNKNFPQGRVFTILGKEKSSADEIACSVDPFSYVSHLSAMEYHGLTDRLSKMLFLSSPNTKTWHDFANQRIAKDLGDNEQLYRALNFPLLQRLNINKIGKRAVNRHSSIHLGAYKNIKDTALRIATIGRTFFDMIHKPEFCGGIYHVIDTYQEFAKKYLNLLLPEIDKHGTKMDKARAGYILESRCDLNHSTIDSWAQDAQRGGSRKLDPAQEYSSNYSERWGLSINIG